MDDEEQFNLSNKQAIEEHDKEVRRVIIEVVCATSAIVFAISLVYTVLTAPRDNGENIKKESEGICV